MVGPKPEGERGPLHYRVKKNRGCSTLCSAHLVVERDVEGK